MEKARKPGSSHGGQITSAVALCGKLSLDILDQLQDAVFLTDLQGIIRACNLGVNRYGYAPEELIGKHLAELLCGDGNCLAREGIPAVLDRGRFQAKLHGRCKSGQEFCCHFCLTLVRDGDSGPTGMVGISIDVTEAEVSKSVRMTDVVPNAALPLARRVIDGTEFVIASPVMHKFMGMVDRVAGHTETVLITGETGTGKELVARTIHESSHRRGKSLVDINCAALPEHLVESELFGYEKGAFSGADSSKPGLFELADKSTIFLDEIGELQPQIQVKLLRVLDGAPYYRLGGHRKITVVCGWWRRPTRISN